MNEKYENVPLESDMYDHSKSETLQERSDEVRETIDTTKEVISDVEQALNNHNVIMGVIDSSIKNA